MNYWAKHEMLSSISPCTKAINYPRKHILYTVYKFSHFLSIQTRRQYAKMSKYTYIHMCINI